METTLTHRAVQEGDRPLRTEAGREPAGEEPVELKCPDCDRTFTSKQGLSTHRARTHGKKRRARKSPVQRKPMAFDEGKALALIMPESGTVKADAIRRLSAWLDEGEALYSELRK